MPEDEEKTDSSLESEQLPENLPEAEKQEEGQQAEDKKTLMSGPVMISIAAVIAVVLAVLVLLSLSLSGLIGTQVRPGPRPTISPTPSPSPESCRIILRSVGNNWTMEGDPPDDNSELEVEAHMIPANPSDEAVVVSVETVSGSAVGGEDFVTNEGTLVILPGQSVSTDTFVVDVIEDLIPEWDPKSQSIEKFDVEITGATGAGSDCEFVGKRLEIQDDDSVKVSLEARPSRVVERHDPEDNVTVKIWATTEKPNPIDGLSVDILTEDGTAISNSVDEGNPNDYVPILPGLPGAKLRIPKGATISENSISIEIVEDRIKEGINLTEYFKVKIDKVWKPVGDDSMVHKFDTTVTIVNDDGELGDDPAISAKPSVIPSLIP